MARLKTSHIPRRIILKNILINKLDVANLDYFRFASLCYMRGPVQPTHLLYLSYGPLFFYF